MDLNHLHLHATDLARSRAFWERWFGFREETWHGPILFLRNDAGFQLALAPSAVTPLPDWWHVGFRLESPQAVRRLSDDMREAGVAVETAGLPADDFVSFRVRDPDGYLIEVYFE